MKIINLFPQGFGSNCYLVEDAGEALIIDPSASADSILAALKHDGCVPVGILLTHGHFDHIFSADTLRRRASELNIFLPLMIHADDSPMLSDGKKSAFYTFFGRDIKYAPAERLLCDGDTVTVGNSTITVRHTPGHSPGSVCYICESAGVIFTGDTIFADGYGRYDLWGGSREILANSIKALRELDGNLTAYPGHGDSTRLSFALDNILYVI
ncbi:MAG: MBL fold metallo-hydrolase [Ruminococcaceae bacterium]|nr:MBL fold metallo-hydrolase [Oscillospiraceae bacterium]